MRERSQETFFSAEQHRAAIQRIGLRRNVSTRNQYFCYRHSESRPSLNVSFEKGIYHCFSCGDSGTINQLCRKVTGRSEVEVLGLDADAFALFQQERPKYEPLPEKTESDFPPINSLIRGAVIPFSSSDTALEYLRIRGIPVEIATAMKMMYTEEAYVFSPFDSKRRPQHLTKRLIIPIYDSTGRWINMEARDTTFQHPAKVLYPPDSIKTIYEWDQLNRELPVYLFEGILKMAVARSDPYFTNSTAMMGTGLTSYQIRLLNTFKYVIHVRDNDEPGKALTKVLQKNLTGQLSTMDIVDQSLKDVDEIPTKKHTTVREYREKGGFILNSLISFVF